MTQREIQHLYLRAGFGASVHTIRVAMGKSRTQLIETIFAESSKPTPIDAIRKPTGEELEMAYMKKDKTPEEKKMIRDYVREEDKKLNLAWLKRMMTAREMLNEKMTFFWHDHFACKDNGPIHAQSFNNTLRKHALGDFRVLLSEVSKEPAMLKFLNNQQNKKNAPNENFAREVLELFTLGRGHYSEADIKNAARAFTGWGFDRMESEYVFREKQHDFDQKTFLGVTGILNGDDILHIISEQKQCALFITDKIYRYFVNENGNNDRVAKLADELYKNGYSISGLMHNIFSADWFYDEENIGTRIKSPIELICGLGVQFVPVFKQDNILLLVQRILGQYLFNPPNVAGWPNGKEWIDSSSLIFRTSLGKKMIDAAPIDATPKPDDDKSPNEMTKANVSKKQKGFNQMEVDIKWSELTAELKDLSDEQLTKTVAGYLLQTDLRPAVTEGIDLAGLSTEAKLKKICSAITSLPEYQLY